MAKFILSLPGFNYKNRPELTSSLCQAIDRCNINMIKVLLADERVTLEGILISIKNSCDRFILNLLVRCDRVMDMLMGHCEPLLHPSIDRTVERQSIIDNLPRMTQKQRKHYIYTNFFGYISY
jgi:hypothetical protein